MQLLQDIFIIEQLQVLSEGKADGPMKIRGVFGRCNEKNNNGRIYPTSVLESQLAKVKPLISERRLCGELDHPSNDTVKLSNASHLITKLDMKGDELIGEAEILRTPAGLTAKALVEGGVKIGISSRGMGTLSEDHNGDKIVNEDFRLVTFDLVADPSTRGAYPGLSESVESKFVKDSQSKLTKESNFVTMLESKMRDAYTPWIEEAKAKKKAKKKDLPGNQEEIDINRNGKIEPSDFEELRKESMDLIRKDGHWHRIADAIAEGFGKKVVTEAFADELEKEGQRSLDTKSPAKDTGGMLSNFRAKRHAKGMEVAAAKGRTKGKDIEAKGEIKRARRMEKAKTAAAAGEPVTTGEKVAAGAKSGVEKVAAGAKGLVKGAAALPGKTIDKAVDVTNAATQAKHADRLARGARTKARGRIADRKAAKAPGNKNQVEEPVDKNPVQPEKNRKSDTEIAAQRADSTAKTNAAVANVKRKAGNKSATSASFEKPGSFGSGVSDKKTDKFDVEASRKAIARREKKTGKNVKLSPEQAAKLEHKAYKQIGLVLAEALIGTNRKSKSGDLGPKQNPLGNSEDKPGGLVRTPRLPNGNIDDKTLRRNMKANTDGDNAKGSGNKAKKRKDELKS